jgi:hypothetical protein
MLLHKLIEGSDEDFCPYAWEAYDKAEHKGPLFYGNHNFKFELPADELRRSNSNPGRHSRIVHELDTKNFQLPEHCAVHTHEFPQDCQLIQDLKDHFNFDWVGCHLMVLKAQMLTAVHFDLNRAAFHIVPEDKRVKIPASEKFRRIVFLQDQKPGQGFQVGEEYATWRAGDIMGFPWYMPHSTYNCTNEDRYLLSVNGFIDPDRETK